jgi:hypothetical protein
VRQSLLIILAVAALSSWFARMERAPRVAAAAVPAASRSPSDWVRTVDGWERRSALMAGPPVVSVSLHPGLLAAFQVGASLLALALFPGRAVPIRRAAPAPAATRLSTRRRMAEPSASH